MDDETITKLTGKIEETIGKETFATISDTIGEILTGNAQNMRTIADKDAEIAKLKDRNEKLVTANGALLQRVPMGTSEVTKPRETEEKKPAKINLKDAFDKNGKFLR